MKKLLVSAVFLIIGVAVSFAEAMERCVTYNVSSKGELTVTGLELTGSVAEFTNTYGKSRQMIAGKTSTLSVSNYEGYIIKGLTLHMYSNSSSGAGTFYFKIGNNKIAEISNSTKFNGWYGNKNWASISAPAAIDVTFKENYTDGYKVETGEDLEIVITATENSLYIVGYTLTYQKAEGIVDAPMIVLTKGDVFYRKQQINVFCEADVDAIYFTTDGTEPTTASQKYDENIPVYIDGENCVVKAFAVKGNEQTKVSTKTFTKENPKSIVAYADNNYGLLKVDSKKTTSTKHLGAQIDSVYNNIVLCDPKNFTKIAWIIKDDNTIQDYGSTNYLNCKESETFLGTSQTKWNVSKTEIVLSDNSRYLCYNSGGYFGAYTSKSKYSPAYPLDLVKGYTRDGLSPNKIGTICLPYDVLNDDRMGAIFYNILGKKTDEDGNVESLILEEETGTLIAGRPYIYEATDNALCCMYLDYVDKEDAAQAGNYKGLCGSFSDVQVEENDDNYIIKNNKIVKSDANCWIAANRAYIKMAEVPDLEYDTQVSKHTVSISIDGEATSICGTIIENKYNTMIYDLHGQRVASPSKGLYIVNGKKTIIK